MKPDAGRVGVFAPPAFAGVLPLVGRQARSAARAVVTSGAVAAGFHKHASGEVAATFSAPVRDTTSEPGPVLGAVVIAEDPGRWLYPYLSLRLGDARTGESVLVRGEGGDAVLLSPLRHDPAPPPAARAVT